MKLLLVHVLLGMLGVERSIRALARDDWETSKQTPKPPYTPDIEEHVRTRVRSLRKKLLLAGFSMGSAAAAAVLARRGLALGRLSTGELGALSAFFAAWAGLARLGWATQSYRGDTSVERADGYIFHVLCWWALHLAVAGNI